MSQGHWLANGKCNDDDISGINLVSTLLFCFLVSQNLPNYLQSLHMKFLPLGKVINGALQLLGKDIHVFLSIYNVFTI